MLGPTNGAQRASSRETSSHSQPRSNHQSASRSRSRTLIGSLLAASLLASLMVTPAAASSGSTVRIPATGAITTSTISRTWYTQEMFYLGLVNCTRTGGWVLADGRCRGYGSGRYSAYVAPLRYSRGISDYVSRPYARYLAVKNQCSHFLDGDPGFRLRRAGYDGWNWGENIGCRDGYSTSKTAVLASHLYYQSEKASNGGHWKNIKNANYVWVGIGVWRYGSRTRLVTDFYRP